MNKLWKGVEEAEGNRESEKRGVDCVMRDMRDGIVGRDGGGGVGIGNEMALKMVGVGKEDVMGY
ncbi:hypothetical protein [Staphylococcus epidermidis]|uniref:hypothetical protein n=1 Tax=Staphylococcus epidermidis TaxID=1282 RepID=UPI0011A552CF|nr:hypothetical protein [Staphylococcus epidermidis]